MSAEPTNEPGGLYQCMSYLDVAEPDGPAWPYFQLTRARDGAFADPDRVPDFALRAMARNRVGEARVALEFLVPFHKRTGELVELHAALREVEEFLRRERSGIDGDVQEHIVAALFGAREIEEHRERIQAGLPVDGRAEQ